MADRLGIVRSTPQVLLDWWGFNGAGSEVLATAYPKARRLVVEPNDGFRARSEQALRAPWWSGWRRPLVEVVSANDVVAGSAQLVWANMMLHASVDPALLFARWQRALSADGFLMFSCLGPGSLRELRDLYARLSWTPAMADLVDMHDLGDMLVGAGFADPVMDQEVLTLTWATPVDLLAELRGLGGNVNPDRFQALRTPRWRARLDHELRALAGADGRLSLTLEVVYGHAFKAPPRAPVKTETSVSLDDMRALVRSRPSRA
jgi:malonyl-CoA O-methyltransferase